MDSERIYEQVDFDILSNNEIASGYVGNQSDETVFLTDNYASYYYKNLEQNFGNNTMGSCGYVAIGMLLSYWDTFWDDNVIPENYDMITMLESNEINLSLASPGIYFEDDDLVTGLTNEQYYQIIEQYSNAYFHLKLIQMGKEQFGQYIFDTSANPTGMSYEEYIELLEYYLYTYRSYTESQVEILSYIGSEQEVRAQTINLIKQGIPVKLSVRNSSGGHAVIAYDYDEESDEIYVHAGWLGNYTHVTLREIGYNQYHNAIAIVFKDTVNHSCSNNFKYSNQYETVETHCVCDLSIHPTRYNITYANLAFQGQTAAIFVNNMYAANPPSNYAWVSGLDLSNIKAEISANSYSPNMVFIGWCSDGELTQPITNIPQYSMGDITLYAKWRYDYNAVTATRDYVLTGDNQKFTYYDMVTIGMGVEGLYEDLTAMGIKYLAITMHINIDTSTAIGKKKIYFYGDATQNSYLGEVSFRFGDGVYTGTAYLPVDSIKDINTLYLRYGGTGGVFSVWQMDQFFLEVMYVVTQTDASAVPFTWASQNPLS